ncbi:HAMP domain-containing methyl-accepting chemotaxis protein [Bradyrhizobium sp. DOA9]|uniref:HAMP domain-containing methyl-accepting chemotaxis protein n=1 Tax=Bradyrhizobium sp. DOA9 TaxID=1126627 RepID=UPI00046A2595|nr:methyl-accepting chemotaxis protein [Bradyrhizobium sp. DOA9]
MFSKLKLRIGGRLAAGFIAVCAIIAVSVGYTVMAVSGVSRTVDEMVAVRTPVAIASTELVGHVPATLSALRGYILSGNSQGKLDRAALWNESETILATLDEMSAHFSSADQKSWAEAKRLLAEFRAAEDRAEAIAFTPEAYPATKVMVAEVGPAADTIFNETTRMIDEEEGLEATAERKRLLKTMADTRGNFAAATSLLRMYLISGKKADKMKCFKPWELFERGLADVTSQAALLTPSQQDSLAKIGKAHSTIQPLYEKIFALRDSPGWNVPGDILATEAAPRALRVLDLIEGPKSDDGTRSGGLKSAQKALLADGAHRIQADLSRLALVLWILLATGLGAGAAIALLTGRAIARPIRGMTAAMGRLAGGDTSIAVPGLGKTDEIGEMAEAVQVFKDNMLETARLRTEQAQAEARAAAQHQAELHRLASHFEKAVGEIIETLSSSSTELEAAASTLSRTAESTQQRSTVVSVTAGEASVNVQSIASATEEMGASMSEIARQVQDATRIAGSAVRQAHDTNDGVNRLSNAATRIGDIVALIDGIAGQTNLLALNATIEAARAGEAGRGFAVVAAEVKALAQQTAKATGEITHQVGGIQAVTKELVLAMQSISGTISRISESSSVIASAIEQQGAATQEISRNIQKAAQGTHQIASSITDVKQDASETGSASNQLLASAQTLSADSARLRSEVAQFLMMVRAA